MSLPRPASVLPSSPPSRLHAGYAISVTAVAGAWASTMVLRAHTPDRSLSMIFFFGAVAISGGVGGLGPGVAATILSALLWDFFFLAPVHTLAIASHDLPILFLFVLFALLVNALTGRLRAETRAADLRFQALVEGLDGIVWEADGAGRRPRFVSRRAEALLGYPVRRWLEEPDFRAAFVHPDDRAAVDQAVAAAQQGDADRGVEYRARKAGGEEIWLYERVRVSREPGGARMTGISVDITERKRAAQELAALKDHFAALNEITSAASTTLELPEIAATLAARLSERRDIPAGAVYLCAAADAPASLAAEWGLAPGTRAWMATAEAAHGLAPHADRPQEPRATALPGPAGTPARTGLTVPLHANGTLYGWVCIVTDAAAPPAPGQVQFLETLGRQMGVLFQNARLFAQVRAGKEHLARLSQRLVEVQEAERRSLARELHDEVGQNLTGLKLVIEMASRKAPAEMRKELDQSLALVTDLMTRISTLSLDLRPAMLDDLGLLHALLFLFGRYTQMTGVQVAFEHEGIEARLGHEVETTAYRIVQEALTNVARHSGASQVTVRIWAADDALSIQVVDTGLGFDINAPSPDRPRGGLTGMKERASLLGGELAVEAAPGAGVRINARLPLRRTGADGVQLRAEDSAV